MGRNQRSNTIVLLPSPLHSSSILSITLLSTLHNDDYDPYIHPIVPIVSPILNVNCVFGFNGCGESFCT